MPINNIAEIADKFTRNAILSSNEIRQIIGFKPSDDPKANQLINHNISQAKQDVDAQYNTPTGAPTGMPTDTSTNSSTESNSLDNFWDTPMSELSGV